MTTSPETIFVTPEGDAGQQNLPIPSLSIAHLLQQREAVITLFQEALDTLRHAHAIADTARLGFPDISMARDCRGNGTRMTGEHANATTVFTTFQTIVDAGGWTTLLHDSGLRSIMSAAKRQEVDADLRAEKVPPLTREAILATFSSLHESRREMFEQGVIECFRRLSWNYKTNRPQKFGKRMVMTYLTAYGSANLPQSEMLDDLLRVFHLCDGKPEADHRAVATDSFVRPCTQRLCGQRMLSVNMFQSGSTKTKVAMSRSSVLILFSDSIAFWRSTIRTPYRNRNERVFPQTTLSRVTIGFWHERWLLQLYHQVIEGEVELYAAGCGS